MTQTLEQYIAQATSANQPATNALQARLDSLSGQLDATNEQINRNYANQQYSLDRSRNAAARSASVQAAHNGGAFGGMANIANQKYYDQAYVPAIMQLQTNQANDLSTARINNENTRNDINAQMANIQAQANQSALAQYYADQEAERNRAIQQQQLALQRQQLAEQQRVNQYQMDAAKAAQTATQARSWDFGNGYSIIDRNGKAVYLNGNRQISAGDFLKGLWQNGNPNWDQWNNVWNGGVSTPNVGSDTISKYLSHVNSAGNNWLYNQY